MQPIFHDARLKIERANKHIAEMKSALLALEKTYTSAIEDHPLAGAQSVIHTVPNIERELRGVSLIVGDAIHNIRTALDFSWVEVISRRLPDKLNSKTSFPVRKTRKLVEDALHGIEIDTRFKELWELILDRIQPYNGGHNEVVWTIHDVDISDKHLLALRLAPHGHVSGITVRDKGGQTHTGNTISVQSPGPFCIDFESDIQIEDKGELSIAVTLEDAGIFHSIPVDSLLPSFSQYAYYVIQLLENI